MEHRKGRADWEYPSSVKDQECHVVIWHYGYFFRQLIARLNWIASNKNDKDGLLVWFINKGKLSEKLENGYKHFKTSWLEFSNYFSRDSLWLHNVFFRCVLYSCAKKLFFFAFNFVPYRCVHGQKIISITMHDENWFRNVFESSPLSTAVAMMLFFWDRKFLQGSRLTSTHGLVARLYFFGLTSTS